MKTFWNRTSKVENTKIRGRIQMGGSLVVGANAWRNRTKHAEENQGWIEQKIGSRTQNMAAQATGFLRME